VSDLQRQIEAAFDYRGHVTVQLSDGKQVEGFLYNRSQPREGKSEAPWIDLYRKGDGEALRLLVAQVQSIELSGEDCALKNPL
jgi:hypothetical protein